MAALQLRRVAELSGATHRSHPAPPIPTTAYRLATHPLPYFMSLIFVLAFLLSIAQHTKTGPGVCGGSPQVSQSTETPSPLLHPPIQDLSLRY